jgi:hypothetical protein
MSRTTNWNEMKIASLGPIPTRIKNIVYREIFT